MVHILRNMLGHSTIAQISTTLVSLTKALFALEKPWRLGIPLPPSMLTITLSRFQTSIVFFLNNSHQFTRFILFSCFSLLFYLAFFVYISPFRISILSVEGCRLTVESSCYFLNILASKHFLPFKVSRLVNLKNCHKL